MLLNKLPTTPHLPLTQAAPYILESMAEGFAAEAPLVRLELLASAAQLFFKRAPETRPALGALLSSGLTDSQQDVHDRALLYYRCAGGNGSCEGRPASITRPLIHDAPDVQRIMAPPLHNSTYT